MIVLGHKGYSAKYPENTVLSFRKAIEYGADGVELDVWLTSDGRVVLNHDPTIKENFGVDVDIKGSTLEELRNYEFRGERIATLDEVYEALPDNAVINVEIKDVDASVPAIDIVKKYNALDRTLFSSFKIDALKLVRETCEEAKIGLLIDRPYKVHEFVKLIRDLKLDYVNPPIEGAKIMRKSTFKFYLRAIRAMGPRLIMWTVNDYEEFKPYMEFCHGVITDEVEKMVKLVRGGQE